MVGKGSYAPSHWSKNDHFLFLLDDLRSNENTFSSFTAKVFFF